MTNVKVGMRVEFIGKRGMVRGTVARLRIKTRRKLLALARRYGEPELMRDVDIEVAEIAPDNGTGFWTVPCERLTILKGEGDKAAAKAVVEKVKRHNWETAHVRKMRAHEEMVANKLYELRPGDKVVVEFRDRKRECVFRGVVGGYGRVRVELENWRGPYYKIVDPKFVKKVEATA